MCYTMQIKLMIPYIPTYLVLPAVSPGRRGMQILSHRGHQRKHRQDGRGSELVGGQSDDLNCEPVHLHVHNYTKLMYKI